MVVALDRRQVVSLYGLILEAERSIDFALGLSWADLRDYYSAEKKQTVRHQIDALCQAAQHNSEPLVLPDRAAFVGLTSPFGDLMRLALGRWSQRWQCTWSFSPQSLVPMAACLHVFLGYLDLDNKPALEDLVILRMCLCEARSFIERRCYGLPELTRARTLKHFGQADWITPTELAELVEPAAGRQEPSSLETR